LQRCPRCIHIRDEIGPWRESAGKAWSCIARIEYILRAPGLGLQEVVDLVKREVFAAKYPEVNE
jgi:hypothetical protein